MEQSSDVQMVTTKLRPGGDKVRLTLPGVDLVEEDGELIVGADLSPDAARELACNLICWAGAIDDAETEDEEGGE